MSRSTFDTFGRIASPKTIAPAAWLTGVFLRRREGASPMAVGTSVVVQGLSELPFMQDVRHWGAFTIGTGLGNAAFTNRRGDG
jgi:hypothetical protein